jgi:hypothetical protein
MGGASGLYIHRTTILKGKLYRPKTYQR